MPAVMLIDVDGEAVEKSMKVPQKHHKEKVTGGFHLRLSLIGQMLSPDWFMIQNVKPDLPWSRSGVQINCHGNVSE